VGVVRLDAEGSGEGELLVVAAADITVAVTLGPELAVAVSVEVVSDGIALVEDSTTVPADSAHPPRSRGNSTKHAVTVRRGCKWHVAFLHTPNWMDAFRTVRL